LLLSVLFWKNGFLLSTPKEINCYLIGELIFNNSNKFIATQYILRITCIGNIQVKREEILLKSHFIIMNFIHSFPGLLDTLKIKYKPDINAKKEFIDTYEEFLNGIWMDGKDVYIYVKSEYLPARNILPERFRKIDEIHELLIDLQCSDNFIETCIKQFKDREEEKIKSLRNFMSKIAIDISPTVDFPALKFNIDPNSKDVNLESKDINNIHDLFEYLIKKTVKSGENTIDIVLEKLKEALKSWHLNNLADLCDNFKNGKEETE